MKTRPTSGGEATSLSPSRRHGRPLAVPPLGGDRHKRESPPRRGKMVAISAKSPTLGSTRVDSAPSTRRALEGGWPYLWGRSLAGWSWSSEASGVPSSRKGAVPPGDRANAPATWAASYGGGRIAGSGTPASPASSPSSRPETIFSSGSAKARARRAPVGGAEDRAGARAGAVTGKPRWLRILLTTAGSERNARTTIGTVRAAVEHLGHASPSTCNTRRRSCSQENLRRRGPGGSADPLALSPCSCTSAEAAVSKAPPPETSGACRDGGGGNNNLRALLRFANA